MNAIIGGFGLSFPRLLYQDQRRQTSVISPFSSSGSYPVKLCPDVGARDPDAPGQGDGAWPTGVPGREKRSPVEF